MQVWKNSLVTGYQKFRSGDFKRQKDEYSNLGHYGQNPKIMLIACSDSRVNPSMIFHALPGQFFTLRNIANIVPPYKCKGGLHGVSASIEYAVNVLNIEAIVVLGHESCGGIAAYLDGLDKGAETEFIGEWIQLIGDAHERISGKGLCGEDEQKQLEFANIRQSLVNLMGFPFVEKAVGANRLSLLGAYFSIIKGKLLFANEGGEFVEVPIKAKK